MGIIYLWDPRNFLGQPDLTKRKMHEVLMRTAKPDSAQEVTKWMVKILDRTYAKADLEQVFINASQLDAEERTLLPILLEDFKNLFYGTLGDLATESVDL